MKVIWAILCQNAIVAQESNNLSLIEVIDELTVPAPPPRGTEEPTEEFGLLLDARLVILWSRDNIGVPEIGISRTRLVAPDGRESLSPEIEIDLTHFPRSRSIGRFGAFPFPPTHVGEHFFKIEVKTPASEWVQVSELPLMIQIQNDTPSR